MKILLVTPQTYPPQSAGGSLSSTHELGLLFRERGHEVAVACGFDARGVLGGWIRLRRKLNPRNRYACDSLMGYRTYRGWDALHHLREVKERFAPDVAIAQAGQTLLATRRLVELGIPTFAYIRDVAFRQMGAEPTISPLAGYLANSQFTADAFSDHYGIRPRVIPPLISPHRYRAPRKGYGVLHINPFPQKGIDITLELARRRPDIPFIIVESWTVSRDVERTYKSEALTLPNVEWRKSVMDMRDIYGLARIVIAPSRVDEAWGRVATEAQVSGIPVLASRRGGLPEAVGPGGILVDPDAPIDAWDAALSRMWDNYEEYDALSAAAIDYSRRPEIQRDFLISMLESELRTLHQND